MTASTAGPILIGLLVLGGGYAITTRAKKTGVALIGMLLLLGGGWFIVVSVPATNDSAWRGFWLLAVLLLAALVMVFRAKADGTTVIGIIAGIITVILIKDVPPVNNLEVSGWVGGVFDALASGGRWIADKIASW